MNHLKLIISISLFGVIALFFSCKMTPKKFTDETPTRGNIKIAVDESYQLLADTELFTFHSLYKDAKVAPVYLSGDSILKLFLDDSVRVIITSSKLTDNEVAYLRGKSIIPRTTKIAYDALAFIVNKSNADSLIRYNTLKDIFTGKTSKWEQINPQSKLNDIKVVFDNQGSNNVKTIMNKFGITGSLPNYCFSATKNSEVINFVESHPEAIGIISVNWISDPRDSISHSFLSKINVVSVTSEYDSDGSEFYSPHPAYIANQSYPFIREVYTINRESFAGLGTGFTSFVAGDAGQRIILKMGMLPATMPIRLVEVKKN
ncbi:MAG: phosphate ABC transporter substrate-binding protein [Odoribacter sp.]|nr:phosphate ABC transporter substrate-binding protein [Odoribacter sp.]